MGREGQLFPKPPKEASWPCKLWIIAFLHFPSKFYSTGKGTIKNEIEDAMCQLQVLKTY